MLPSDPGREGGDGWRRKERGREEVGRDGGTEREGGREGGRRREGVKEGVREGGRDEEGGSRREEKGRTVKFSETSQHI